ncbi:hypothetical protein [Herbinix luporum]|uniref:SF0329 family protein n=1 Tax=Herbinix luporum TaxID=1679721 RepID=UPI0017701035|nr:hypothetical protein [Herbinix luporum]HHT57771.1 hypothetical protein [Herbinix luporum]
MVWSKLKQNLESFLCPELVGRVEYRATSYHYLPDKLGRCYITVDKKEVLNMSDTNALIRCYQTEQEIKNNPHIDIPITEEDINEVRRDSFNQIPEDRLKVVARNRKISTYAKELLEAQAILLRSDFYDAAKRFLTMPIDDCLKSNEILLNIFALVDRRVGKRRLMNLEEQMSLKHPIVQYFYKLRIDSLGL